jgi:CRP/FNR family transcriptional regulator
MRSELLSGARLVPLHRGQALSETCELAFVTDGVVKVIRRVSKDRETILRLVETGGLLLDSGAGEVSFVAFSDNACVLLLAPSDVKNVLAKSTTASTTLLAEMRGIYFEVRDLAGDLTVTPLPRRIAWILARLGRRFGLEEADGTRFIPLSLSRQDIADLSGTTLETAIRVMSRLRREEVVKSARSGIAIKDPDRIQRIATGEERLRARVR